MRVSIWQQFSSNHSNSFTVVGTFASEEDAAQAAATLYEIFGYIGEQSFRYFDPEPVPAEQYYGEEYDIQWDRHLDWVNLYSAQHIMKLDNVLFVGPMGIDTYLGAYVIDELVAKLGGHVQKEEEMRDTSLRATVKAQAPDYKTAQRLHSEISAYLDRKDAYWQAHAYGDAPAPPWIFHYRNKPKAESYYGVEFAEKLDALWEIIQQQRSDHAPDTKSQFQAWLQEQDDLVKPFVEREVKELAFWYGTAILDTCPYGNEINRAGEKLNKATTSGEIVFIENLSFGDRLGLGLPALVNWLRDKGCQVDFSLESRKCEP
jgi:hypothetical protein